MNTKKLITTIVFVGFLAGCGSTDYLKKMSPFKKEEPTLESTRGEPLSNVKNHEEIFVCAGDIDTTCKKLGEVSLGDFGFSGHDILAAKIRE